MSGYSNLFGAAQQPGPKPALSFRAGKMNKEGNTVTADPRKGIIQLVGDQGFIHFQWKDRLTGNVELDLLVFPDEAKFYRVEKVTTGRVYLLKFEQGEPTREFFFWMQEPSDENDEKYCKMIANFSDHPMTCQSGASEDAVNDAIMQGDSSGQSRSGGAASAQAGRAAGGTQGVDLATLQAILNRSDMGSNRPAAPQAQRQASSAQRGQPSTQAVAETSLNDLFSQPEIRSILSSDDVEASIREHFPEGLETTTLDEIRSPQFRQCLSTLQAALTDPQARQELVTAFQLPAASDTSRGSVDNFLRSIMQWAAEKKDE
ncbi:26S proteasome regulatory subunit RPN13 [Diplonema papillatum]|nr:26S proteasome regulatory subunit RPN13 [Diplonema papillatum]|eukprot:gene8500-13124_t